MAAEALGVATPNLARLSEEILSDLAVEPPYGVQWWVPHPGTSRRILISDQLYACTASTAQNLGEGALHWLEFLDYAEQESDWFVDAIQVEGDRLVVRAPRSRHAMDDVLLEMVVLHIVGVVRAIAAALDCLGGAIIGVAALPRSILRADYDRARQALQQLENIDDAGRRQQIELRAALSTAVDHAGPLGWIEWALAFRNMLVHRGRRITISQFVAREPILYGPGGRPVPRTKIRRQLPADPGRSDVEVFLERECPPVLTEDAEQTLGGLLRSAVSLVDSSARALLNLWIWRREHPEALSQPREQWANGIAPAADVFRGYAEGSAAYSPTAFMSHPVVVRRLRAAALDDTARPRWATFD